MSLKLVEYLNYGIPTISTRTGMRGTNFEFDREIILAEINEFPDKITQVYRNPDYYGKIGENGQRAVRENYSWNYLSNKMLAVYNAVNRS